MRTLTKTLLFLLVILLGLSTFYIISNLQQKLGLPTPLRGPIGHSGYPLTVAGILAETNKHRQTNNLAPLVLNPTLSQAADNKLKDMFARQYFDHDSPDGIGPADIVDRVNYQYLRIGENLALGNYTDDIDLVQAWMDSPGHRANILSQGFTEIGIAAAPGQFDDRSTWLAVQTFALPANTCPQPDETIQQSFNKQQTALSQLADQLSTAKNDLQQRQERIDTLLADATRLSNSGNKEIARGNTIIKDGKDPQAPNTPSDTDALYKQARQLQQHGQTLQQQATAASDTASLLNQKQTIQLADYNNQVTTYNQLNEKLANLADQINQQINSYNDCANLYLE
jgi:molybdopterin converting factor small subunit